MIFTIAALLFAVSFFKEMDKAKENKDLCEIVYWGALFIPSILMIYFYR